jgi:hypothetical protein
MTSLCVDVEDFDLFRGILKLYQEKYIGRYIDISMADRILHQWMCRKKITKLSSCEAMTRFVQQLRATSSRELNKAITYYIEFYRSQIQSPNLFYTYAILLYPLLLDSLTPDDIKLFKDSEYFRQKPFPIELEYNDKRSIFQWIIRTMHEVELGYYTPNSNLEETLYLSLDYVVHKWTTESNISITPSDAFSKEIVTLIEDILLGRSNHRFCTWRYHIQNHPDIVEVVLQIYWKYVSH